MYSLLKKIKFLLVVLIFGVLSLQGNAQNRKNALSLQAQAEKHYHQQDFKRAIIFAVKAISKDSLFADPYILLAAIYQDKNDVNDAIIAYRRGIEIDSLKFRNVYLTLAELELQSERFNQAVKHASRFLELKNTDARVRQKAQLIIGSAQFRQHAFMNPLDIFKQKLNYNSEPTDEYINSISLDGKKLLYTQKKLLGTDFEGVKFYTEQILEAELSGDSLIHPRIFEMPPEMRERVGAASLSTDGRYLFFTSCNQPQSGSSCDLYGMSLMSEDHKVFNLGRNINSQEWESQPCFSADGKSLYFASKRKGGYGGSDIWISTLNNEGSFCRPKNAGPAINTPEDEMAPFIHADTRTLYFSSKGHPGMGGFDLFVSRKDENGEWTKAENLGYPLNTSSDEINMIIAPDGINAYLSAEETHFDLYHFLMQNNKPSQVTYIKGLIIDAESLTPLFARVELINLTDNEPYAYAQSYASDGHFIIPLPLNQSFAFHVNKDGYLFYSENFNVNELIADTLNIALHPIRLNEKVALNNIFFETDKFILLPESKAELSLMIKFMELNSNLYIEIGGHTDNVGTPEYNQTLSENRAKAVYDYLIKKGIMAERLSFKGYGETEAISSNETEKGRALNRRTEFKIVE